MKRVETEEEKNSAPQSNTEISDAEYERIKKGMPMKLTFGFVIIAAALYFIYVFISLITR